MRSDNDDEKIKGTKVIGGKHLFEKKKAAGIHSMKDVEDYLGTMTTLRRRIDNDNNNNDGGNDIYRLID